MLERLSKFYFNEKNVGNKKFVFRILKSENKHLNFAFYNLK